MLFNLLFLVLGFVFLIKGAGLLVDGAVSAAKKFKLSDMVIGMTIVAFGTSAPELFINLIANFNNASGLALGNIIGANIANILLIAGVAAIIYPIRIKNKFEWTEIVIGLGAIVLIFILANDFLLSFLRPSYLGRLDGIALLLFFLVFVYYTLGGAKNQKCQHTCFHHCGHLATWLYIIIGIAGLSLGGKLLVDNSVILARYFGLSEAIIGLSIIAIGTTLPELAASAIAAWKKEADLAIGNVIGSVVFNFTFILGLNALIKPIPFDLNLNDDLIICVGATAILLYFIWTGKKRDKIEHWEGIALFCAYLVYISYLFTR